MSDKKAKHSLANIILAFTIISGLMGLIWYFVSVPEVNLTHITISIVDTLQWHQGESQLTQAFTLFVFLAVATSCALPRQIAALVAGINLGAALGAFVATLAAAIGCCITFSIARYFFSDKIKAKYPKKLAKLSKFLGEDTFLKTIVIRLLPLGSNFLTNIVAGVSNISMKSYVSASFLGCIPQMAIFALAGSGIRLGAKNEMYASVGLFVIALCITAYLYKKHQASKQAFIDVSCPTPALKPSK